MSSEKNLGFHERGAKFPAAPSVQSRIFTPRPRRTGRHPYLQPPASHLQLRALIANLELEFDLTSIRISDLKFSNRKFLAIFCLELRKVRHFRIPWSRLFLAICHSSLAPAFLIVTRRLEFHATARKQTPRLISNRYKTPVFLSQLGHLFSQATIHEPPVSSHSFLAATLSTSMAQRFCEVALPVPLRSTFTYAVPASFNGEELIGRRVVVPFRNRAMVGVGLALSDRAPEIAAGKKSI